MRSFGKIDLFPERLERKRVMRDCGGIPPRCN
jgi:hypothetical protein